MISVVIPTYNRAQTLERAIGTVLQQTYKDIECIVIDDASTDDTQEVLLNCRDPRLKYKKLGQQHGACYARNCGIAMSQGEYIAFQDSDDIWLPNKLERQMEFLAAMQADIVFCQMISENLVNGRRFYFPAKSFQNKDVTISRIYKGNFASTQTILGKRECFEKHSFDISLPRFQDWDLAMRLVTDFRVHYQPEVLVHAFVNKDSISSNPDKGIAAIDCILQKWEKVYAQYPRAAASVYSARANMRIQKGENPKEDLKKQLKNDPFNFCVWMKILLCKTRLLSSVMRGMRRV